jgi:hypothetical protein
MSMLGASRFTALLAAIAISGMAGTFWWAFETRSDMKAAAGNHGASRALPSKFTGRVSKSKDDRPGKFESNKFELMGKSERPQPSTFQPGPQPGSPGRSEDQDQPDRQTPVPLLANYPNPGPAPNSGLRSRSLQSPISQSQSVQNPSSQSPSSQSPSPPSSWGDMPLPALPAMTPLAQVQPDTAPWQARASDPPMFLPQLPAPPSMAENPKRQTREARPPAAPAAARAPKPPAQSYYMEKFVEQGEYRYRRRACEPPNMPDVCFMPQADRQPVVVAKP